MNELFRCRLCGKDYTYEEMSEEHYPAHCTGNEDLVAFDLTKMLDLFMSGDIVGKMYKRIEEGASFQDASDYIFDKELSKSIYPKGRTARTLCKSCNAFLGTYDEAYLKFFNCDGDPKIVRGFQPKTKLRIIKSIFGKFLSIPEAINEEFDFIEFVRDESIKEYQGRWKLYFIKRDNSTDLMGFSDIRTGAISFDEGIVYEMSDDKFIFDLMMFPKHDCFEMTDIFDINSKRYRLTVGAGESGGYHAQIFMSNIFRDNLLGD